jgi:hypothetical protein
MILNTYRTREFNKEKQKQHFAHLHDYCDQAEKGRNVKYPNQISIDELDEPVVLHNCYKVLQNV